MQYYDDTLHFGETFAERTGEPLDFDAAIGQVIESFSFLEQSMRNVITMFLDVDSNIGEIVTAELSFKGLFHLLSSLFKYKNERGDFDVPDEDIEARFKELMALCARSEQLRNQIAHSSYVLQRFRVKKTAKARHGLKTTIEKTDANEVLDISDFIASTGMHVEELPMFLNMATSIEGGSMQVRYLYGEEVVATFGHDVPD